MIEEDDEEAQQSRSSPEKAAHLNKACEACRTSKLRCIVDDESVNASCKRCLATSRTCVFKAPRQRQRRHFQVDARVAELERQLRSLRIKLHQAQNPPPTAQTPSAPPVYSTFKFEPPVTQQSWPRKSNAVAEEAVVNNPSNSSLTFETVKSTEDSTTDVVDRKVIDWDQADRLVRSYLTEFVPSYPFVTLPFFTNTTALRQQHPATFLAILAATSAAISPALNTLLNHELLALLAKRIMIGGEQNLDLVQAMVIMTIWCAPMDKSESLRHYQFAHLAAAIAMDLGIGDGSGLESTDVDGTVDLDRQRTLLSICVLCTGISITTGRSKMVRFTEYMQKCTDSFRNRVGTSVQDQWFLAWVDLQRLTESAANKFFVTPTDISVPSNQTAVSDFCRTLDHWRRDLGFDLGGALQIHYHYVRSIVLSVCLYGDHDMADFVPPFRVRSWNAPMPSSPIPLCPFYARTAISLAHNLHSALDSFLAFKTAALPAVPVIYYVRTLHPLSILLMLDMACRRPGNELCKLFDQDSLKVAEYFQLLKQMLSEYGEESQSTPAKFLAIVHRMEAWWLGQNGPSPVPSSDLRPLDKQQNPPVEVEESNHRDFKNHGPSNESMATQYGTSGARINSVIATANGRESMNTSEQDTGPVMDSHALFQDSWVTNFEYDPSTFLLPEIDWAFLEEQEMLKET